MIGVRLAGLSIALLAGCGGSKTPAAAAGADNAAALNGKSAAETIAPAKPSAAVTAAKASVGPQGGRPVSELRELLPGAECPQPGPELQAAIAKAGLAKIPLKVGLTLSHVWKMQSAISCNTGCDSERSVAPEGNWLSCTHFEHRPR